ncbi:MAG: ABC transporter permease [Phycisphaerales bacterium]
MLRIALLMLLGDRGKYLALVLGLSFAVLLIAQQAAIFLGLLTRATGVLQNVGQADLWVTDKATRFVSEARPMSDTDLLRVRSIDGVAWAQPLFAARAMVELDNSKFQTVQLLGIDRTTMIGRPPEILEGSLESLRAPDAVMLEDSGREKLGHPRIGDTLRLNDQRAVVVGFCRAKSGFDSNVIVYTTYDNALQFVPVGRKALTFILVKAAPGRTVESVASEIEAQTGLGAFTREKMQQKTIQFIITETGIGINFGITVLLGFIVGLVVSGAILYQFTLENLRNFGVLKAMGARTRVLIAMILLQAFVAGIIGYGIGVGLAGTFGLLSRYPGSELTAEFPWQLLVGALAAMLACVSLGSILSLRRVVALEPAIVFK